jgi:hypothetical protein
MTPSRSLVQSVAVAGLVALVAGLLARHQGRLVRLEIGAFDGGHVSGDWSRSRRLDVDPQATTDGRLSFYFRTAPAGNQVVFPVSAAGGTLVFTLRGSTSVRGAVGVFLGGERAGEVIVRPGPWGRHSLELSTPAVTRGPLEMSLALRPLPLVRGDHVEDPELRVDYLEVEAPQGLVLTPGAWLLVALVPLFVHAFALAVGASPRAALAATILAAAASVLLAHVAPMPMLLALPRLVPLAAAAGLFTWLGLSGRGLREAERAALAGLVAAGTLFHGSVVFFPDHNPPDIDIHVRRTLDLAGLPASYEAWMRYGSQLPTASQDLGQATAALGERTLIPYSPLPYFFYYVAHLAGLDLYWAMTALNAALVMLVAPLVWAACARLFGRGAAWLAALLYTLDLAVWHHVGRSHAPAVFGGALGTAALLYLLARVDRLDATRRAAIAGVILGVAVLGYSSLVVLIGLFGLTLLALLVADAHGTSPACRRGLAIALVVGGLLAGGLFYFHYVPGLLGGARGVEAEPDLFPGKTFLIFHNESRQSLRIWLLGFWIPLLAGLLAAPLAFRRMRASARPIALAWLLAWAAIMLLKEPLLFPKLLRWAKEDQFLSPLLCLLVAGGVASLPRPWMRRSCALLAVATAVWLQLRDFAHHANSLRL